MPKPYRIKHAGARFIKCSAPKGKAKPALEAFKNEVRDKIAEYKIGFDDTINFPPNDKAHRDIIHAEVKKQKLYSVDVKAGPSVPGSSSGTFVYVSEDKIETYQCLGCKETLPWRAFGAHRCYCNASAKCVRYGEEKKCDPKKKFCAGCWKKLPKCEACKDHRCCVEVRDCCGRSMCGRCGKSAAPNGCSKCYERVEKKRRKNEKLRQRMLENRDAQILRSVVTDELFDHIKSDMFSRSVRDLIDEIHDVEHNLNRPIPESPIYSEYSDDFMSD